MHVTPETRTMTAQITPIQTRPERGEGSKALTWLSEKRRRTARSLQSSFPYPKTPAGTRPLHSKCKVKSGVCQIQIMLFVVVTSPEIFYFREMYMSITGNDVKYVICLDEVFGFICSAWLIA